MLNVGDRVLIRRRSQKVDAAWFIGWSTIWDPRFSPYPENGWLVHEGIDGAILLEALVVPSDQESRFLSGEAGELGGLSLKPLQNNENASLFWKVHPIDENRFMLECQMTGSNLTWLAAGGASTWVQMTKKPSKESVRHEFIALPLEKQDEYSRAERARDFSFLPVQPTTKKSTSKTKPKTVRRATLKANTPRERSGDDPVAQELIRALQPSFNDAKAGAINSVYDDPTDERKIGWPHNIISLDTVAKPTGIIHLHSSPVEHEPAEGELLLCQTLASEVVAALGGVEPFGGDSPTPFLPFYLVAGQKDSPSTSLTSEVVRETFRGTIFPETPITVQRINPEFVATNGDEWEAFAGWVQNQKGLEEVSYIDIGYDTCQEPNLAAVFPRLVIGRTKLGSLVGACGTIVQA